MGPRHYRVIYTSEDLALQAADFESFSESTQLESLMENESDKAIFTPQLPEKLLQPLNHSRGGTLSILPGNEHYREAARAVLSELPDINAVRRSTLLDGGGLDGGGQD